MANIAMNKLKSKLTTRNNFTGRAMDRMTKENLKELFQGNLNYISWEKTFLQRKFHPDEYIKEIREHRRLVFAKQQANAPDSGINYEEMLQEDEKHDVELQKRFQRFSKIHNGDKPLLILDVDNTMVYVRFFSEEMQIGDVVTYFGEDSVCKNNSRVIEVRLTLNLEITSSSLIDKFGSERMECNYWAKNNALLKKYKKKNGVFDYKIDENEIIGCKIRKVEVTGCKIHLHATPLQMKHDDENMKLEDIIKEEADRALEIIEIDFTKGNEELSKLEPMLERSAMADVDFIFEGFLVRCRPNLDEFLEYCNDDYDVVIYTSANKLIYEGMLQVLHEYVKDQLGREDEDELILWTECLYRDDCTLDYDSRGKPYHHKDLTLFGCDLSRVIMVDNSPIVCRGEEPNFILIKDYFGKDGMDDELMEVYQLLDALVDVEGDVRYLLCGLESDESVAIDLNRESECWSATQQLMQELDAYYSEQIVLSPVSSDDYAVDEADDMFMDDYDEEDILDRERLTAHSPFPVHDADEEEEEREEDGDDESEAHIITIDIANKDTNNTISPDIAILNLTDKTTSVTSVDEENEDDDNRKKVVSFNAPSIDTNAKTDPSLRKKQTGKSLSAKKAQSTRAKSLNKAQANKHFKRNRSLLLDPDKLQKMGQRHVKYSSMSPRYALGVPGSASMTAVIKPKFSFNDLDVNDAIHSFGAVDHDTDDDDDDEDDDKHLNRSSIKKEEEEEEDTKRQKVPQFDGDTIAITSSKTMPIAQREFKNKVPELTIDMNAKTDDFIPPPSALNMTSVKSLDKIKAEKLAKRKKRLSEKRNSSMKLSVNSIIKLSYNKRKKNAHRRGLSSDAIADIDFGENETIKYAPGKTKHKMSIADTEQFGKVWRNTMAPRPSAKSIVNASSKHDEFILLFQQHLKEIKENQLEEKQRRGHNNTLEKRRSVPDFAMLSEIDNESDINAHRLRLSTLRDEQIIYKSKPFLQSVNEDKGFDADNNNGNNNNNNNNIDTNADKECITDWNNNISQRHGCCYYFCCCCICNMFVNKSGNNNNNNNNASYAGTYSPHSP